MTNEQINIAIAEACGWNPPPEGMGNMTHGGGKFMSSEKWRKSHLPNYCNDLNAMHEAEKTLSEEVRNHYIDLLGDIYLNSWEFATATSMQRAEAFLKTIGKWEESK
jgi:hypothetical protein